MTESSVYLQPAFIMQQRKYRETSLIIDLLTRDFGLISLLAKGVRTSKSKTVGLLQPFIPLTVSYTGKAELKILSDVEAMHSFNEIKGMALYCGFYINELITCFLHKYDPHPELFSHYSDCLSKLLHGANIESALRQFELKLMACAGYGLQLDYDHNQNPIDTSKKYQFTTGFGLVAAQDGLFSGETLLALNSSELTDPKVLTEAKILMRMVIDGGLQGKQLKSRTVIHKIIATTKR